ERSAHRESHTDHSVSSPPKGSVVGMRRAWRGYKKGPQKRARENKCGALYWVRTSDRLLRRLAFYPDELMAVGGPCWI
ncbi:hypothetical protein ACSRPX_004741, partial [Escherichia coli]